MKKIAVITGTRAEYGLLKNIIREIDKDDELILQLIVTGMHLSQKYGLTVNEIIKDGFKIDEKCPILLDYNGDEKNALEMSLAIEQFTIAFKKLKPDIVLILGDRYEIFAAATTAMLLGIPIAHIAGGEITEGAMDEQIRHAITKMAHIHFPGAEEYEKNIRNMGEEAWRIFNVGDSGIENIKLTTLLDKDELKNELGFEVNDKTLLVTYHPVTLELNQVFEQISNLIEALRSYDGDILVTYPNSDNGGDIIIEEWKKFSKERDNIHLFESLGSLRYLSVMKYCGCIVGNSSSALIEAPYLKKPVVNIGNRQQGRLMADNIINVDNETNNIVKGINKALSYDFMEITKNVKSLYGEGETSKEIVKVLKEIEINEKLLKKKLVWSE